MFNIKSKKESFNPFQIKQVIRMVEDKVQDRELHIEKKYRKDGHYSYQMTIDSIEDLSFLLKTIEKTLESIKEKDNLN